MLSYCERAHCIFPIHWLTFMGPASLWTALPLCPSGRGPHQPLTQLLPASRVPVPVLPFFFTASLKCWCSWALALNLFFCTRSGCVPALFLLGGSHVPTSGPHLSKFLSQLCTQTSLAGHSADAILSVSRTSLVTCLQTCSLLFSP